MPHVSFAGLYPARDRLWNRAMAEGSRRPRADEGRTASRAREGTRAAALGFALAESARILADMLGVTVLDRYVPLVPTAPWIGPAVLMAGLLATEVFSFWVRRRNPAPFVGGESNGPRGPSGPSLAEDRRPPVGSTQGVAWAATDGSPFWMADLVRAQESVQIAGRSTEPSSIPLVSLARTPEQALIASVAALRLVGLPRSQVRRVLIARHGIELTVAEVKSLELKAVAMLTPRRKKGRVV